MHAGDVVAERFEIERIAGRGGMAVVYRAIDRVTGEPVALKVLLGDAPELAARFVREGRALAELRHPAIVRWIAHGETPEGLHYIAMEWLDGAPLSERLRAGPLGVRDALVLGVRVAEALGTAHAHGIVHRDVKPANLHLVGGDVARVKVLDFGVARLGAALVLTRTGVNPGTPSFMAPEQARGERTIDARADVFSLGCVLFRCLTGRAPFIGDDIMAVLAKLVFEEAPRLTELVPGVPRSVEDLVARLLSKDPEGRPANGTAAAEAIRAVEEISDATPAPTPPPRPSLGSREQRLLCVVLAGREVPIDPTVSAVTVREERPRKIEAARRVALEGFGARAEVLAVGPLVVTVTGAGAATDLASKAARCALAIRALLPGEPMAIATGRGLLGERLPVGEAIDRASSALRAGQSASTSVADAIRLDEVTAGLLDGRFDVRGDRAGLVLRGERPDAAGPRTVLGRATPFVGRDRERNMLVGLFDDVRNEATAGAVLVTGPAGSGKSRLLAEFLATAGPPEVWVARADPVRAGAPFGLVDAALRDTAGLREGEDAETRSRKLRARIRRDVLDVDLDRVSEFLGELSGVRSAGEPSAALRAARADAVLMGDPMQRAFVDLVAGTTRAKALVLVLEDLQWGDGPSLRLVEAALRTLRDRPLFVLGLSREGPAVSAAPLSGRLLAEIRLGELPRRACEGLVRTVLGADAARETVDRIVDRSEGNPFALEELLRADAVGNDAPGTVLATVQARLESLPADDRRVLRAASIFGRVFSEAGVAALVGRAP